ncbi:MAG TPA: hypothetical protein VIS07_10290 [Candidatus Binatia bacterium]
MRSVRTLLAWLLTLVMTFAGPAASIAECLSCPPDCPMHARATSVGAERGAQHDGHGAHDAALHDPHGGHGAAAHAAHEHAAHGASQHAAHGPSQHAAHQDGHAAQHALHADADAASQHDGHGASGDCHREHGRPLDAARSTDDGPCISGTCGHMDPSIARVLPVGVVAQPPAVVPVLDAIPLVVVATPSSTRVADDPPTQPPRQLLS